MSYRYPMLFLIKCKVSHGSKLSNALDLPEQGEGRSAWDIFKTITVYQNNNIKKEKSMGYLCYPIVNLYLFLLLLRVFFF